MMSIERTSARKATEAVQRPAAFRNAAQRGDALDLLTSLARRLRAVGILRPAAPGRARQARLRQRRSTPTRTLRLACDGRGLHRCLLPRDRARAGAERLLDALARHLWALRGPSPARRRLREIRRSHCLGQLAPGQWLSDPAAGRLSAHPATTAFRAAGPRRSIAKPIPMQSRPV